jgi:very-short-patch-repair endonuclease
MLSHYYSELENNINKVIELCESPIEERLLYKIIEYVLEDTLTTTLHKTERWFRLSFLYKEIDGYITNTIKGVRIDYSGYNEKNLTRYIEIIPQYKIQTNKGDYRLDFGVFLKFFNSDKLIKNFCLECDGYMYHNRREQIMRDNQRDLVLISNNFQTIRLLGSQINNITNDYITDLLEVLFQEKLRNF